MTRTTCTALLLLLALTAACGTADPPRYASTCEGCEAEPPRGTSRAPDPTPPAGAVCPEDGPLELDVETVALTGAVTVEHPGGEAVPWAADGYVVAQEVRTSARVTARLDAQGRYALEAPAGDYDVSVCFDRDAFPLSCPGAEVARGLRLEEDFTLDHHVIARRVSGRLTLDGRPLPAAGPTVGIGELHFVVRGEDGVVQARVRVPAAPTFEAFLPEGPRWEVVWTTAPQEDHPLQDGVNAVPMGAAVVGEVDATRDVSGLHLSATSVELDATFTFEGRPIPDDTVLDGESRGMAQLSALSAPGWAFTVDLGEEGEPRGALRVFPGPYQVMVFANGDAAQDALPAHVYGEGCGDSGGVCAFGASGPVQVDVAELYPSQAPTHRVAGRVRLLGGQEGPEAWATGCAAVSLRRDDGRGTAYAEVVDGRFEAAVPTGVWSVWITSGGEGCPLGASRVQRGLRVEGEVAGLDLEVRARPLHLEVLVDGAAMPDDGLVDAQSRGALLLVEADYGVAGYVDLGESGPARVERLALEGSYRVHLDTTQPSRRGPLQVRSQDVLPTGVVDLGPVEPGGAEVVRQLHVHLVPVRGQLGAEARSLTNTRGQDRVIILERPSDGLRLALPVDAEGDVQGLAYEGRYLAAISDGWSAVAPLRVNGGREVALGCR